MTHEDSLRGNGYTICSPISGSMKPLIRPNIDSAVFVSPQHICRYEGGCWNSADFNIRNGCSTLDRS